MSFVIDSSKPVFDAAKVGKGWLLYARHRSWNEGRGGIVTRVSEDRITVQFAPGIGNVMNHFIIPAAEVEDGQWEIRCSKDLTEIEAVSMAAGGAGE